MKQSEQDVNKPAQPKSKRPEDWSPEERLTALQKTYNLIGEDLNAWCRERGVFIHQLEQWKTDFCSHDDSVLAAVKKRGKLADIDDGNRPSILVNKKGARYGPFLL